jgi:uncharacterized protein
MEFEWDDQKNLVNIAKHRIDFADALHVFLDPNRVERLDTRKAYDEERWQTLGTTEFGLLFVVYTERREGEVVRLISARPANRKERRMYGNGFFTPFEEMRKHGN